MKAWPTEGSRLTLYYAIGSNMFQPQSRERFPHSFCLCNATLQGYKFAIVTSDDPADDSASGFATVLPNEGSVVHGVLFALTPDDEKILDEREDVAKGDYIKMECFVLTEKGQPVRALVYVNKLTHEGPPNKGYLEKIVEGARSHGLPSYYIAELESWAIKH